MLRLNQELTPEYSNWLEASHYLFHPRQYQQGDLLKLFRKVGIDIPLLDAIKQAKFLKELCIHKRKKMKGAVEMGGIVSILIKHKDASAKVQRILPKKCQDSGIFSMPCTIGNSTFAYVMLD
ncbi:hypothetical protein CR513_36263, partial [Mucuna pruriens]